jgi:hypothetical protein
MLIERINATEQGLVLGALLDGREAEARFARLTGPTAERCRGAFSEIQQLEPRRRRRCIRELSRRFFNPIPDHLDQVHPSWLQQILEQEPFEVIQAALSVLPPATIDALVLPEPPRARPSELPGRVLAQIFRSVLSRIEPMPDPALQQGAGSEREPAHLSEIVGWSSSRLEATINHLGCLALAALLVRAEESSVRTLREQVLERMEEPYRAKVAQACSSSEELPIVPIRQLGDVTSGPVGTRLLFRLGARLLATGLSRAGRTRRQLAQRLPRKLGLVVLEPADREATSADRRVILPLVRLADRWARGEELS